MRLFLSQADGMQMEEHFQISRFGTVLFNIMVLS